MKQKTSKDVLTTRGVGANAAFTRRSFLKSALQAGAALMLPQIVPGSVLGRDGVAPSERIVLGAIGIGNRGNMC